MEIEAGYKKTDVGIIPEQWKVMPLGDVLSKARLGGNYANGDEESSFPLMKMGNLGRGRFDFTKIQFVVRGTKPADEHQLVKGDVLLNTRNTLDLVGKVAIWKDELPLAFYNSNLLRLEFDPGSICSNEYACSFLNTEGSLSKLRALATGTTSVAAIYTRDLLALPIAVPPAEEQRAIATALSDVDALIAGLERLIAKKRDIKQATMQQLLTGQTRLPGFSGEWRSIRLADLTKIEKGQIMTTDLLIPGDVPVIAGGKQPAYFHAVANREGMTITVSASGASAGYVAFHKKPIFASDCSTISEHKNYSIEFLFFSLLNKQKVIYGLQTGGAQPHVQPKDLAPLLVPMPPNIQEQTAIAAVLSDMDADLSALEARLAKTRAIKQGMMQELLTGRTRLLAQT